MLFWIEPIARKAARAKILFLEPCAICGYCLATAAPPLSDEMTGLLDRLEAQELIRRERCVEDRRVVYVEPTANGLELLNRMDQPVKELHKLLMGHLTATELRLLSRLLEKARTSLDEVN